MRCRGRRPRRLVAQRQISVHSRRPHTPLKGSGMPLPAPHLRLVQAAVKMANASELSLRGGQRPTWRPEREARGSALGVQSREGSSVFAGVSLLSDRILRDSHVASLLGMTNLRASRHRMRIADIASLHGGHGPPCRLTFGLCHYGIGSSAPGAACRSPAMRHRQSADQDTVAGSYSDAERLSDSSTRAWR